MEKKFYLFALFTIVMSGIVFSCSDEKELIISDKTVSEIESQGELNLSTARINPYDKVGELQGSNFVITEDLTNFKTNLANGLSAVGITATISSFRIMESATTPGTYMLVGKSSTNKIKAAVGVILDNNTFYIDYHVNSVGNNLLTDTVVCQGGPQNCTQGCDPEKYTDAHDEEKWKCTDCSPDVLADCSKTTTVVTKQLTQQTP